MISVTLLPNHYKSREREREGSQEDERETEHGRTMRRAIAESETGPGSNGGTNTIMSRRSSSQATELTGVKD